MMMMMMTFVRDGHYVDFNDKVCVCSIFILVSTVRVYSLLS